MNLFSYIQFCIVLIQYMEILYTRIYMCPMCTCRTLQQLSSGERGSRTLMLNLLRLLYSQGLREIGYLLLYFLRVWYTVLSAFEYECTVMRLESMLDARRSSKPHRNQSHSILRARASAAPSPAWTVRR